MSAEHSAQIFLLQLFVLIKTEVQNTNSQEVQKNSPFLMDTDQPSIQRVMTVLCWGKAVDSAI